MAGKKDTGYEGQPTQEAGEGNDAGGGRKTGKTLRMFVDGKTRVTVAARNTTGLGADRLEGGTMNSEAGAG